MKYFAQLENEVHAYDTYIRDEQRIIEYENSEVDYDIVPIGPGRFSLIKDHKSYNIRLVEKNGVYRAYLFGEYVEILVESERERRLKELVKSSQSGPREQDIKAPIPGLVVKVEVSEGDEVKSGQALLILEAMKMENVIKAPFDCRVDKISVTEKEAVQQDQTLLRLISAED